MSACHWWRKDLEWWWQLAPHLRAEHIAVFIEHNTRDAYTTERVAAQAKADGDQPADSAPPPAPWSSMSFHQGGGTL